MLLSAKGHLFLETKGDENRDLSPFSIVSS